MCGSAAASSAGSERQGTGVDRSRCRCAKGRANVVPRAPFGFAYTADAAAALADLTGELATVRWGVGGVNGIGNTGSADRAVS
jgi:hypothetical protein